MYAMIAVSDIDERVANLEKRLADLESRPPSAEAPHPGRVAVPIPDSETFWALAGLRNRLEPPGGVLMTGSVTLPTGVEAQWQEASLMSDLLDHDPGQAADAAEALAALGHPVRLQLLHQILSGADTVAALTLTEGMGTSGQVYHHLRPLIGAGWLRSRQRGRYEVPAPRVVPLLVMFMAAHR